MSDKIMWISDDDAEFLIGADGYPYDCVDDEGNTLILFNISDTQEFQRTAGSVTRLLVVEDGDGKLWGTHWMSLSTGTPGFTWDATVTKRRDPAGSRKWRPYQWVGFRPIKVTEVTKAVYDFEDLS